jgi:YebC/PmpR family DNA-binding regulatory protein
MSGHSKWSTIKRAKGVADIKRGQTFTKLANNIALAVKAGGSGDPDSNPRLRMALETAKAVNLPKENIQRAIDRGLGKGKESLEELVYEGFGPGHVAFYVEAVTDNRLRTNQEIRSLFDRSGGALGGSGSVGYMFEKKGEIHVKSKGGAVDDEMLELIDTGADDVEDYEAEGIVRYVVYTPPAELYNVGNKIIQLGYEIESQELIMKPTITQQLSSQEVVDKVLAFAEKLEEHDDIQKVFANFEVLET